LNQEITRQEASVITARRAARTKGTCIVYNILSSLYILRRTHAEE